MKQQHLQSETKASINERHIDSFQSSQELFESELSSVIGGSASRKLPSGWRIASVPGGMLPASFAPIGDHC